MESMAPRTSRKQSSALCLPLPAPAPLWPDAALSVCRSIRAPVRELCPGLDEQLGKERTAAHNAGRIFISHAQLMKQIVTPMLDVNRPGNAAGIAWETNGIGPDMFSLESMKCTMRRVYQYLPVGAIYKANLVAGGITTPVDETPLDQSLPAGTDATVLGAQQRAAAPAVAPAAANPAVVALSNTPAAAVAAANVTAALADGPTTVAVDVPLAAAAGQTAGIASPLAASPAVGDLLELGDIYSPATLAEVVSSLAPAMDAMAEMATAVDGPTVEMVDLLSPGSLDEVLDEVLAAVGPSPGATETRIIASAARTGTARIDPGTGTEVFLNLGGAFDASNAVGGDLPVAGSSGTVVPAKKKGRRSTSFPIKGVIDICSPDKSPDQSPAKSHKELADTYGLDGGPALDRKILQEILDNQEMIKEKQQQMYSQLQQMPTTAEANQGMAAAVSAINDTTQAEGRTTRSSVTQGFAAVDESIKSVYSKFDELLKKQKQNEEQRQQELAEKDAANEAERERMLENEAALEKKLFDLHAQSRTVREDMRKMNKELMSKLQLVNESTEERSAMQTSLVLGEIATLQSALHSKKEKASMFSGLISNMSDNLEAVKRMASGSAATCSQESTTRTPLGAISANATA